jgi:hypothetical protein
MKSDGLELDPVLLADEYVRKAAAAYPTARTPADDIAIAQVYATLAVAEALKALRPAAPAEQ